MNDPVDILSISWNLGDGNLMMDTLSFFYGNYPEPNTYFPEVTIMDDLGCEVIYPLNEITVSDDGLVHFHCNTQSSRTR